MKSNFLKFLMLQGAEMVEVNRPMDLQTELDRTLRRDWIKKKLFKTSQEFAN